MSNIIKSYDDTKASDLDFVKSESVMDSDFSNQYSEFSSDTFSNDDTQPTLYPLNRTPDSTDDFEHLEHELEMQMQNNNNRPQQYSDQFSNLLTSLDNSNNFQNQSQNPEINLDESHSTDNVTFKNDFCDLKPLPATPPPSADLEELKTVAPPLDEVSKTVVGDFDDDLDQGKNVFSFKPSSSKLSDSHDENFTSDDTFFNQDEPNTTEEYSFKAPDEISEHSMKFEQEEEFSYVKQASAVKEQPDFIEDETFTSKNTNPPLLDNSVNELCDVFGSGFDKYQEVKSADKPVPAPEPKKDKIDDFGFGGVEKDFYSSEKPSLLEDKFNTSQFDTDFRDKSFQPEVKATSTNVCSLPSKTNFSNDFEEKERRSSSEAASQKKSLEAFSAAISKYKKYAVKVVLWQNPKESAIILGLTLAVLISLTYFSIISVISYTSLLMLLCSTFIRIYRVVSQSVQKSPTDHMLLNILDADLSIPTDKIHDIVDIAVPNFNAGINELRRLFLVEDIIDSLKFGIILWSLTYLGSWFNGMTLIILVVISLFTFPKVYEKNKTCIDKSLLRMQEKIASTKEKAYATLSFRKKDEDKKK